MRDRDIYESLMPEQWESTAPLPPVHDKVEPQTPAPGLTSELERLVRLGRAVETVHAVFVRRGGIGGAVFAAIYAEADRRTNI